MVIERTGGAAASALPSIYFPPWAGGEPCQAGPLGVPGALQDPVDPRGRHPHAGPHPAKGIGAERKPHPLRQWHVHQLFRRLRHRKNRRGGGPGRLGILGTSISCVGTKRSTICSTSSNWSTICGTRASRAGNPRATSPDCSTVCRRTRSCGLTSWRRSGQEPPSSGTLSSSSSSVKCCVPGSWRRSASGTSPCTASRTPPLALAVFWRCAPWCWHSARAIATV